MTQTVVVTGASGGIGRATAIRFARRGAAVALLARGQAGLDAAAQDVRRAGGVPFPVPVDMADSDAVFAAAQHVEDDLGPIDIWVNVAFSSVFAEFRDVSPEEYRRATEVTYFGFVWGTMAALKHMQPRDRGAIVQTSSALAYRGIPLQTVYCGAKHAALGFTEALRCELIHQKSNVRVTMVAMPAVNTPQFSWLRNKLPHHAQPVPPIYQPEVAAEAITHAADHPRRRAYWVGTPVVKTILGQTAAPGLLDRYLARAGYSAQQTDQPNHPGTGNLFDPADGPDGHDFGAHGEFDDGARTADPQLWASRHHGLLALAGGGLAGAAVAATRIAGGRA